METALDKPYLISWLIILPLVLIGLLFSHHTLAIQLHDTYFVVANNHIALAGSALLLILGIGYWISGLTGKIPNRALTLLHLLLTTAVLMLAVLPLSDRDDIVDGAGPLLSVTAFLIAQCVYAANILITLLRR